MIDQNFEKEIDDELWSDIQTLFEGDLIFESQDDYKSHSLEFGIQIASGFRFRYQSEIDKKSYSAIKGEKNQPPSIKVMSSSDVNLKFELVTESCCSANSDPHFNTLYEVSKLPKYCARFHDGFCEIPISRNSTHELKLDFLGIRKWKLKEAIPRIKELYPHFNEVQAKQFFNKHKECVKLRATLCDSEYILNAIISGTIKSQIAKENKLIKIQHISPKTVADSNETLIIILEKKITGECTTHLLFDDMPAKQLQATYEDGQTFVYGLPPYNLTSPTTAKVRLQCSDSMDEKPIRFQQPINEVRKRKTAYYPSDIPLKKPTNYDSPQELYPESGNMDIGIEHDGAFATNVAEELEDVDASTRIQLAYAHLPDNTSCKDSGIQSNMLSSNTSDIDSDDDEDGSSFNESAYDSDEIEIEGVRRRRENHVENLEPINFPPRKRSMDSHLIPNRKDQVANKIFSEVARIGHDFAFGKQPIDLFDRIEKQLPVVFTLQDDVGDTPLNNAILKGNETQADRILKVVQSECKWALDLVNTSGQSALILAPACDVSDKFIIKLLNAGCDIEKKDDLGKSALTYAIEYNNTPALIVLLEYIKQNNLRQLLYRSEKEYFNLLQLAVMNSYEKGVKLLLFLKDKNGQFMVDVNERALMNGDTALHIAVERNVGVNILQLLLERPDIDINHQKDNATTVLHTALKMNLTEIVMLLKQNHAEDINDKTDPEEIHESADDIEFDDDISSGLSHDTCMAVEVIAEIERPATNVAHLTDTINQMSIKGTNKNQLVDLLLNGDIHLSIEELQSIVRPAFKTLFSKYNNTNQHKSEIIDVLDRFNCLPNSFGQMIENLREINRPDMILKVMDHFGV